MRFFSRLGESLEPHPLRPSDIDIWAMRDLGYVRATDIPALEAMNPDARGQLVADYVDEPSLEQRDAAIATYEELAAHLSDQCVDGRSDWTSRGAWSLGRAAAAENWGADPAETLSPVPWQTPTAADKTGEEEHRA
jgi:hypothetical protein